MSKFHQTKGYKYWRKRVYIRGGAKCAVTGQTKGLCTHHLFDESNFPKWKLHVKKGIVINKKLHREFHIKYMGGYGVKCDAQDFLDFLLEKELVTPMDNLFWKLKIKYKYESK